MGGQALRGGGSLRNAVPVGERWEALVDAINAARIAYYQRDAPTLADAGYDELYRELVALETAHPG